MIAAAVLGVGLIFLMAGVVRILDARRASTWRQVAAERRQSWEARQGSPAAQPLYPALPGAGR